jgi:hypothetical protein
MAQENLPQELQELLQRYGQTPAVQKLLDQHAHLLAEAPQLIRNFLGMIRFEYLGGASNGGTKKAVPRFVGRRDEFRDFRRAFSQWYGLAPERPEYEGLDRLVR